MYYVGGVVSYARGNAWGLGFESHGTQRWEVLFFLKLEGPLVPGGPRCLLLSEEPGLEGVSHRK